MSVLITKFHQMFKPNFVYDNNFQMYFIEHVMTKERYTNYWLLQMNYVLQVRLCKIPSYCRAAKGLIFDNSIMLYDYLYSL